MTLAAPCALVGVNGASEIGVRSSGNPPGVPGAGGTTGSSGNAAGTFGSMGVVAGALGVCASRSASFDSREQLTRSAKARSSRILFMDDDLPDVGLGQKCGLSGGDVAERIS